MKKLIIIAAICAVFPAGGCGNHRTPVVRVVTSSPDDGTQGYEMIYEGGKVKKTGKFTPEANTIYQADFTDFSGLRTIQNTIFMRQISSLFRINILRL